MERPMELALQFIIIIIYIHGRVVCERERDRDGGADEALGIWKWRPGGGRGGYSALESVCSPKMLIIE